MRAIDVLRSRLRRAGSTALGTYAAYTAYGLVHPRMARQSATAAERAAPLPGDELVPDATWRTDFAGDIAAPPAAVWPWLVQMGYGRGGYYTWYPLDNGGVASATEVVPELQRLAAGDLIPDGPRAAEGFGVWRVVALDPPRALVLHSRRDPVDGREIPAGDGGAASFVDVSWAFALAEIAPGRTRLHVRVRGKFCGPRLQGLAASAAQLLFGVGDNVMENSLLAGVRARAEARPAC